MWIVDARYGRGGVELWCKEGNRCVVRRESYRTHFHLHLPDTHANACMVEALEGIYGAEECRFRTIYGPLDGYRVRAGRDVAEKIEVQSHFSAALYDVDLRGEQRFMAERGLFPCGNEGEDRLSEDFESPLTCIGIEVEGNPQIDSEVHSVSLAGDISGRLEGGERAVLSDLLSTVESYDPDLILFPNADFWMHIIARKAEALGLSQSFSRDGAYSKLDSRSYWSYGKVNYRAGALIPHGRVLIDTEKSFTYEAGGLKGVLMASRLTGMSPNMTSRLTPGTLISGYEAYEAIRRGISIPFRKSDPERLRKISDLKARDRGGMIFQPAPGISGKSYQIDYTSLYPSIIVKFNLSPESLDSGGSGFLSEALAPLLDLRIRTKRLKKAEQVYAGLDSVLKWMLVTCFGYTGYRNAKFGSIEVHERITSIARDILVRTKDIAEEMGFDVLHGIVDCLWVRGGPIWELKARVEAEVGIPTEVEEYDWLVFLEMADGFGAYNRYYGRLSDGEVKSRGIMANRRDCPEYVKRMQLDMLEAMAVAKSVGELCSVERSVMEIRDRYAAGLRRADPKEMVVNHRIGKLEYDKDCLQRSALNAYKRLGVELEPGMTVGYVVRDARKRIVDAEWDARGFDAAHYAGILEKASAEVTFAFESARRLSKRGEVDRDAEKGAITSWRRASKGSSLPPV